MRCILLGLSLAALVPALTAQKEPTGNASAMAPYTVKLEGTAVDIPMVPIPVGTKGYPATFQMGSPDAEEGRKDDEGPAVKIEVAPFWMGKFEITWDTYNAFTRDYVTLGGVGDGGLSKDSAPAAAWADAVSLPTPIYELETATILEGMGSEGGYPVAAITHLAARQFAKWLSKKTGHFYRLPTEAEWEYAARAGTTTRWSFGNDAEKLSEYAWYFDNSGYEDPDKGHPDFGLGYRKIGTKKPNPWGLFDMHGNVAEWVIDQYAEDRYGKLGGGVIPWHKAVAFPTRIYPCIVRGGSWDSDPEGCRSAARASSDSEWQDQDPQLPQSLWWLTDGFHVGFRLVRPLAVPDQEEQLQFSEPLNPATLRIINEGGKQLRAKVGKGAK